MITLKLTKGELTYLANVLLDGSIQYDEMEGISCYNKVVDAFCNKPLTLDAKPNANQVWEALKGVVG
jgi:hypothetical protein